MDNKISNKMKVLVRAYMAFNLGDDLFLDTLFRRYPMISFEVESWFYDDYKKFTDKYDNVTIRKNKGILARAKERMGVIDIERSYIKKFDMIIYIGGSIFKENPENDLLDVLTEKEVEFAKKKNIPYYFMSCNWESGYSEAFIKRKRKMFESCTNVFFRDKYSYEMFKDIESVRYSEDVVFFSPYKDVLPNIKTQKILGISVIDFECRSAIKEYAEEYKEYLLSEIRQFADKGYKIRIFAFSVREGDLRAAEEIYNRIDRNIISNVSIAAYNGNIDEIIYSFAECEKIICTRFHSMVLAVISKREFYPIIYSDKLLNIINDMSLCDNYYIFGQRNNTVFNSNIAQKGLCNMTFIHLDCRFGIDKRNENQYN